MRVSELANELGKTSKEILEIIKSEDNIKGQVEELVRKANENGGKDNITAMIINPL